MRKLPRIRAKADFVVAFYKSTAIFMFLLGIFLVLFGYFLNQSYFLKFTIDNKLTPSALQKIKNIKVFLITAGFIVLSLFFLFKYRKNHILSFISRKKVLLQNLTLLFLTIFIVIIILELSIRVILSKEVKYNFPPGLEEFSRKYIFLNKEGYRDIERTYNKDKNTIRIVVLGDSFTFGSGIKNVNDRYSKKLEKILNNKSKKIDYEVLNFGKPGVDTEFEIKILKNEALRYDPDIIIVGYVLNDFRDKDAIKAKKGLNTYFFWLDIYLRRYSYLYHFTNKGFNIAFEATGFRKSYYQTIIDAFNSENNKEFNKLYFKELKELSQNNNATLIIVVFPFIYKLDDYPFAMPHGFIAQAGDEYGITVLDLLPYFKNLDEKKLIANRYDNHPNELGHQIAADAIYEKLIKLKIVQ